MSLQSIRFFVCFIIIGILCAFPKFVRANEGRFSIVQNGVDCEGVSVWQNGAYQISGICSGLVYPYHDQLTGYALWVQPDTGGNPVRVTNIDRGIISGPVNTRFTGMFVTAESAVDPRSPSSYRIVTGNLTLFNFPLPYQNQTTNQMPNQIQMQSGNVANPSPIPAQNTQNAITNPLNMTSRSLPILILAGVVAVIIFALMYVFRSK